MNNTIEKFLTNRVFSVFASLFLIYALYYSLINNNYFLVLVTSVFTLAITPYILKKDIPRKKIIAKKVLFAAMLLLEVLVLSYNFISLNYSESQIKLVAIFSAAAIFFIVLNFKQNLEILLSKYKLTSKLIIVLSLLFSFYLWGPNLNANWGMTDDHMIMHYFIDNPEVSLLEVPQIIMEKTEVGKFGNTTINRPFYYSGRVIESALWQKNVSLWYLARILMFFTAFALFWILLERRLGLFYGGVFIFFISLSAYWAWIWGYLGPAENYAMFGCSLYLYGLFNIVPRLRNEAVNGKEMLWNSLVLLLGSLVAIGSKENFLILVIPLIYVIFLLFKKKIKNWPLILSLAAIFTYSAFIFAGTYLGLAKAGGDVYGQSVGLFERLRLTYENLVLIFNEINLIGILAVIIFASVVVFTTGSKNQQSKYSLVIKNLSLASLVLLVLYASQAFFYNGSFPPSSLRYSFPGMLTVPFLWLVLLTSLFSTLDIIGFSKFVLRQTKNAIFVILLIIILTNGYKEARAFVKNNVATTNSFSTKMTSFYSHLGNNPAEPVVIDSTSVWNVEPIASVRAYLLANNVKNPMYLRLNFIPPTESSPDKIAYRIYKFLNDISIRGGCGFTGAEYSFLSGGDCDQWGFKPLKELKEKYFVIKIDDKNEISGTEKDN